MTPLSALPDLEPILGCSFALNLAYIGLQRFRYRRDIRDYANTELGDLAINPPENCIDTSLYKSVVRLSSLGNDRKIFRKSEQNADLSGFWSFIYECYFECHQDRILTIASASISAALLSLGVAHNIGVSWFSSYFSDSNIFYWYLLVNFILILPVASVVAGWYTVSGAKSFAAKQIVDLKLVMQTKVTEARVPRMAGVNKRTVIKRSEAS